MRAAAAGSFDNLWARNPLSHERGFHVPGVCLIQNPGHGTRNLGHGWLSFATSPKSLKTNRMDPIRFENKPNGSGAFDNIWVCASSETRDTEPDTLSIVGRLAQDP